MAKIIQNPDYYYLGSTRIAIDFDETLVESENLEILRPIPGAVEALQKMHDIGAYISIQTARLCPQWGKDLDEERQKIADYLDSQDIPYDEIIGKPYNIFYVGDEAIQFNKAVGPCWTVISWSICEHLKERIEKWEKQGIDWKNHRQKYLDSLK